MVGVVSFSPKRYKCSDLKKKKKTDDGGVMGKGIVFGSKPDTITINLKRVTQVQRCKSERTNGSNRFLFLV